MTKLTKVNENKYKIEHQDKLLTVDNLKSLFAWLMTFDVYFEEVEETLLMFTRHNHNYAEFGFNGCMTFTKRIDHETYH